MNRWVHHVSVSEKCAWKEKEMGKDGSIVRYVALSKTLDGFDIDLFGDAVISRREFARRKREMENGSHLFYMSWMTRKIK